MEIIGQEGMLDIIQVVLDWTGPAQAITDSRGVGREDTRGRHRNREIASSREHTDDAGYTCLWIRLVVVGDTLIRYSLVLVPPRSPNRA